MHQLDTPILLISYKRLDTTSHVLDSILQAKPRKLYVSNNGPNPLLTDDVRKVSAVRALIDQKVNWPCEVIKLYRHEHLTAKESIFSAISWFFENEPEGIILEDDCVVDKSFYYFAEECLKKYREDNKVTQISASNFQSGIVRGEASYYFSRYNHIWGWAGWRRSWEGHHSFLKRSDRKLYKAVINKLFTRVQDRSYWMAMYKYVQSGNIDTWDYQWMFYMWTNGGMSIIPNVNMILNMGFGKDATNTLNQTKDVLSLRAHAISLPLIHPVTCRLNDSADEFTSDNFFLISKSYNVGHLKIKIATWLPPKVKKLIKKSILHLSKSFK